MITSIHNKRVAGAVRLKKRALREKERMFLVEGAQGVVEALASGAAVREVFVGPDPEHRLDAVADMAGAAGLPVSSVSPEVMAHLTSTVTPQGIVAVVGFVDRDLDAFPTSASFVPILVEVRDPGNAGTILRSADAAGADAVVFTHSSVDAYNPKAVRATAGSLFHVPVVREVSAEEAVAALRSRGFAILAAAAGGEAAIQDVDLSGPTAVLFGNEARGLSSQTMALADRSVRVPIAGRAESLNLAAAATLIMFEAARQRAGSTDDALALIVSGAAHDIRSPLTALKGFALTLLSRWDRLDDAQRLMMVEGIAHDAGRMDVVVSQLVDAARLRSRTLQLALEPANLLEAADRLRAELARWGQFDVVVSGDPAVARVDPARFRSILMAMIEGAHWWGEEGPMLLEVRAGPPPAVTVSRQGTELDGQGAEGLFHPRPPGSGGGSKVGLFVARGLAIAHGGTLQPEVGRTIGFKLTLPSSAG